MQVTVGEAWNVSSSLLSYIQTVMTADGSTAKQQQVCLHCKAYAGQHDGHQIEPTIAKTYDRLHVQTRTSAHIHVDSHFARMSFS